MKPTKPSSKIGNSVHCKSPKSISGKGCSGTIVDEVWGNIHLDPNWGYYVYTGQLIDWHPGISIRLTYYYWSVKNARWLYGQFSPEDKPHIIKELIDRLPEHWFKPTIL